LNLDCVKALKNVIHGDQKSKDGSIFEESKEYSRQTFCNFSLLDEKEESKNSISEESQSQPETDTNTGKLDLKLTVFLTKTLLNCGVKPEEIAIITPLNFEKNYIQSKLDVDLCIFKLNPLET